MTRDLAVPLLMFPVLAPMLGACAQAAGESAPAAPDGSSGWIALGESADFGLRVRPVDIVEDSRCPSDAVCAWAGTLRLHTHVSWADGVQQRLETLTLNEPIDIAGGKLTLSGVTPSPNAEVTIYPAEYRFAFSFDREP